jgi:adenylate cyclase
MPFRTLLKKDESDAYFAQGMIDDIIRILAGLKDLFVIARSSTLPFAGAPVDPRLIGQELEVRYVLHGSVRRSGEQLRVAAELCETWTGQVLWADRFDGGIYDLFDMQDQLALRVVASVVPHIRRRELILSRRKHPGNMTAYDLTLQALDLIHRLDRVSIAEARTLLKRAITHDPNYGPAHSYFAFLQMNWVGQFFSEDETTNNAIAENAAASAIERDDNDALALAMYGHLKSRVLRDYRAGCDYLDRALMAGPSCPWAWGYSGLNWMFVGDYSTALAHSEQAVRLSPIGPDAFWFEHYLSQVYYASEQFEKAVSWGRKSATGSRNFGPNLRCLIASLVALGDLQEARVLAQQLMQIAPSFRLETLRSRTPLPGDMREVFVGRLRQAGVPE